MRENRRRRARNIVATAGQGQNRCTSMVSKRRALQKELLKSNMVDKLFQKDFGLCGGSRKSSSVTKLL